MENRKSEPPDFGKNNTFRNVERAHSTLNVCSNEYKLISQTCPPSPAISTITLTPGRMRNIDQDMENLRISRQDNPFLQQVIASRESLVDSLDEIESDDTNLMSQEFSSSLDIDPFTLPEIHEHMIRSPPPVSWPRSPNFRQFNFPQEIENNHTGNNWDQQTPMKYQKIQNCENRFSILTPTPIRNNGIAEDSIQLMSADD